MSNKSIFWLIFFSLTLIEIGQLAISQEHPIIVNQDKFAGQETHLQENGINQETKTNYVSNYADKEVLEASVLVYIKK